MKQAKLARHKDAAGIGSIVVAFVVAFVFVFVFVKTCYYAGWQDGGGPVGQMADKNYYRPNKRYFSRDECALVRVLFYFVELQPAS